MTDQTTGRKVVQVGNCIGITFPNSKTDDWGIEKGQRYILEPRENGFRAYKAEIRRVDS